MPAIIKSSNTNIPLLGWVLLLLLSFIWGGSFFFIEIIVREITPLHLVTLRLTLAALTLWGILFATGQYRITTQPSALLAFILMGILNNAIPFYGLTYGQSMISSSLAAILNATTPFFTLIIGHIFTQDDRITKRKFFGISTAFVGIFTIFAPAIQLGDGLKIIAMSACIMATISYGFAGIWGRRFHRMGIKPIHAATGQLTSSSLIMMMILGLNHMMEYGLHDFTMIAMPSLHVVISLIILAVICTSLAYLIFFRLLSQIGASNTSLVTMLVPISALLLGQLFLHEEITLNDLIGLCLVTLGLIMVDGRIFNRIKS